MGYRDPAPPSGPPQSPDLEDYERKLVRSARRKKILVSVIIGTMAAVGLGTCLGPIVVGVTTSVWDGRETKLTEAEAREVSELLDPIEAEAKKSQEAFDAIWPKLRSGALGPRKDLGGCRAAVPGPNIRHKQESTSLDDSSQAGWTFIDLTPESPLAGLKMPQGSLALNNAGTGDRYVFPDRPLRIATGDRAPTLDSTTTGLAVAEWRAEAAAPIRHDRHDAFLQRVRLFAGDGLSVDVVVFVDHWEDPKFSDAPPPSPKDDLEAFEKGSHPTHMFESGLAIARAFAWSPTLQKLVCASRALAQNSSDIAFRSNDVSPLQQDLVLQLEKSLARSFVAVGDAPAPADHAPAGLGLQSPPPR